MAEKRFYWLKLKEGYFDSPKIKKLRKIAGGDTYTIIYLKMQLLSISNGGIISFERIEETFEEELALKIDEQVEDVQLTLAFLKQQSLVEINNEDYLLVEACKNIGSEGQSAERVRLFRERKEKLELEMDKMGKALQCNASVTNVKRTSISNSISNIFNYWNDNNIIRHKELNKETQKAIEKALKTYKEEEIKEYIDRYNKVLKDKDWYFDTKWTLAEFLKQKNGISNFTDEGSKWINYLKHYEKLTPNPQSQKPDDYVNVDISYIGKYGETVFDVYPRKKGQTEWTEEDKERILKEKGGKRWIH